MLIWLSEIHFCSGSAVGGRVSFNSNEEHDAMDGKYSCFHAIENIIIMCEVEWPRDMALNVVFKVY